MLGKKGSAPGTATYSIQGENLMDYAVLDKCIH